jgi:actin-related protein
VPDLWRNIVVSGGNTLLPGMFDILFVVDWFVGFSSRLLKELKELAPSDMEVRIINQKGGLDAFMGIYLLRVTYSVFIA